MPAKIFSASVFGFNPRLVEVEVDILNGPASITIVGLGDVSVQEAKERIRSAIKNSDADYPRRKKTINLAPADLRKHGPMFDLPIALGLLVQSQQIPPQSLERTLVIGELSLSGDLRGIPGVLPIAAYAAEQGFKNIIVPAANGKEARMANNINIIPADDLKSLIEHLCGVKKIAPAAPNGKLQRTKKEILWNLEDVRGHECAKRALAIAAAGRHNILLFGPPGSGKTLLARSLQSILPPLNFEEALEVTKIYSVAGKLAPGQSLMAKPPFRAVHHTASTISLVGGGAIPRPGEISLAHKGVLFLDELLEFPRASLDSLRQPMEDGTINVTRAQGSVVFPAEFTLIAATNPCMCGYHGDPVQACRCTASQLEYYRKKLSGPLLDRIDLTCPVPRLSFEKFRNSVATATSRFTQNCVIAARQTQYKRQKCTNAQISSRLTKKYCELDAAAEKLLKETFSRLQYSGRAYFRILKVARTIADLENSPDIKPHHLAEAIQYRPRLQ